MKYRGFEYTITPVNIHRLARRFTNLAIDMYHASSSEKRIDVRRVKHSYVQKTLHPPVGTLRASGWSLTEEGSRSSQTPVASASSARLLLWLAACGSLNPSAISYAVSRTTYPYGSFDLL
jgi:hypothetical protein